MSGRVVIVAGDRVPASDGLLAPLSRESEQTAGCSLWTLWREDLAAHGHDWTRPGFRAIAIYRFGVWRMRIRSRWLRAPFSIVYRRLYAHACTRYGIELPYSAEIGRRLVIEHQSEIVVHGATVIGNDCCIRQGVTLGNRSHQRRFDAPRLGSRVQVGAGAKVLGAVRIGDDAQIGANAVVLIDVPAGATCVGVPGHIVPS